MVLAQSPGAVFSAGTQQVALLEFIIRREVTNDVAVTLSDNPVIREVSDATANALSAVYIDGQLAINPLPVLRIGQEGESFVLSWPASSGSFFLQSAESLSAASWDPVASDIVTNGSVATVTVAATNAHTYYRLQGK